MKLWNEIKAEEMILATMLCIASSMALAGCKAGSDGAATSTPSGAAADTNNVSTNAAPSTPATNASLAEPAAATTQAATTAPADNTVATGGSP